jgi:hypothetical protein
MSPQVLVEWWGHFDIRRVSFCVLLDQLKAFCDVNYGGMPQNVKAFLEGNGYEFRVIQWKVVNDASHGKGTMIYTGKMKKDLPHIDVNDGGMPPNVRAFFEGNGCEFRVIH